jgi:hypothetical protein
LIEKCKVISLKDGRIQSPNVAINLSNYCLHLTTDNNLTGAELFLCDQEQPHGGDIEKQLHKSLVRVIGETNAAITVRTSQVQMNDFL